MKKLGLVGGLGPASTVDYYLGIMEKNRINNGTDFYPEIVIDSVDMAKHTKAIDDKDYDTLCSYILGSLSSLKLAGAEIAAITANTEHIVWDMMCDRFPLPVISIVDTTVKEIKRLNLKKVVIFGTAFTLKSGLYENALKKHDITAIVPSESDIEKIGNLIYPNLENGIILSEDSKKLIEISEKYISKENADSLLLGCTELPLAIKEGDVSVPVLNTTQIHIDALYKAISEK